MRPAITFFNIQLSNSRILDLLDEDDDVQDVYHNWDE